MDASIFSPADLEVLAARGIAPAEAARQLAQLAHPPASVRLERPCTAGDGIVVLDAPAVERSLAAHAAAAAAGRVSTFVPASGAATRMFKDLLAALGAPGALAPAEVRAAAASDPAMAALVRFVESLPRFALRDALAAVLAGRGLEMEAVRERGPWRVLLEALLGADGLDYGERPKALLAFHREAGRARTPFEEQLAEAATLTRDSAGACRLHFTVSPEHRTRFEALLAQAGPAEAARLAAHWNVRFSEQHPATDTLAAAPAGGPFRDAKGALLFRPAGHGALLRNLGEAGGDLVFVKNIDNVAVAAAREPSVRWSRVLVGLAADLSATAHARLARLEAADDTGALAEARAFAASCGEADPPADRARMRAWLARPLRVCGMVPNTGEPGGGPFWVRGAGGEVTRQIVESAQVADEPAQQAVLRRATHFNPVFLACALRDPAGAPWPLEAFVDPDAVIVTRKSAGGRDLLALERPGLWNGAMADWITVFVEVPLEVFNPVKTVFDLLRPEHQGPA